MYVCKAYFHVFVVATWCQQTDLVVWRFASTQSTVLPAVLPHEHEHFLQVFAQFSPYQASFKHCVSVAREQLETNFELSTQVGHEHLWNQVTNFIK